MLKKIMCASSLLLMSSWVFANPQEIIIHAEDCQTLVCVRENIDKINTQLVTLLGERLAYVKRAGELKQSVNLPIHDAAREQKILATVEKQAQKSGYPSKVIQDIFQAILMQSNRYEKNIQKKAAKAHYCSGELNKYIICKN